MEQQKSKSDHNFDKKLLLCKQTCVTIFIFVCFFTGQTIEMIYFEQTLLTA